MSCKRKPLRFWTKQRVYKFCNGVFLKFPQCSFFGWKNCYNFTLLHPLSCRELFLTLELWVVEITVSPKLYAFSTQKFALGKNKSFYCKTNTFIDFLGIQNKIHSILTIDKVILLIVFEKELFAFILLSWSSIKLEITEKS